MNKNQDKNKVKTNKKYNNDNKVGYTAHSMPKVGINRLKEDTDNDDKKLLEIFLKLFKNNCSMTSSPSDIAVVYPWNRKSLGNEIRLEQIGEVVLSSEEYTLLTKTLFEYMYKK